MRSVILNGTMFYFGANHNAKDKIQNWLTDGEEVLDMFISKENIGIFTNKRIIYKGVISTQDAKLIGKEVNMYSFPYRSIALYSYEVSDTTLLNASLYVNLLLVSGINLSLVFNKGTDISGVKKILLKYVIN